MKKIDICFDGGWFLGVTLVKKNNKMATVFGIAGDIVATLDFSAEYRLELFGSSYHIVKKNESRACGPKKKINADRVKELRKIYTIEKTAQIMGISVSSVRRNEK